MDVDFCTHLKHSDNGQLEQTGHYKNGKKNGLWKFSYGIKILDRFETYKDGELI